MKGIRRDQYLETAGARLRFRDEGSGPCVVFIHGWTLDLDLWNPQARCLRDSLRVVRWDRRGFGYSSGRPSLASDVLDFATLCRHLGIERTALVGMSQGARVALRAASRGAPAVTRIVLDGPPPNELILGIDAESDVPLEPFRTLVRSRGIVAFRERWSRHPMMQLRTKERAAQLLLARMIARYPGLDLKDPEATPADGVQEAALTAVRMPTLIINGKEDAPTRRRAGSWLARKLPNAERILLTNAGHLPNLDTPRAYNAALAAFLARRGTQPPERHPGA